VGNTNLQVSLFSVPVGFLYVLKCRKSIFILMVISNHHGRFPPKKTASIMHKVGK